MNVVQKLFQLNGGLKPYQEDCLKELSKGKDSFVSQPTGSGKSLIFQSFPFYLFAKEHPGMVTEEVLDKCHYKTLVICPLLSLMKDQQASLSSRGIKCVLLHHNTRNSTKSTIQPKDLQDCHVVFASPEAILTNYRNLMKSKEFGNHLKLIAIDESHCIKKWGTSSKESNIFRSYYGRLAELRSLVSHRVPVVALTATATHDTRSFIINDLCMFNCALFISTPERKNIRYSVIKIGNRSPEVLLDPIVQELQTQQKCKKYLVFCRKLGDARILYSYLCEKLEHLFDSYDKKPFARFHSSTHDKLKDFIVNEFSKPDGTVRVLICTIAFGMGIDCRALQNVIHFGPPATLEDYFQESGRVGRDGSDSEALVVVYPRSLASKNITKSVKSYIVNNDMCRRKTLLKNFDATHDLISPKHLCCDVCEKSCSCGDMSCSFRSSINLANEEVVESKPKKASCLNKKEQQSLMSQLLLVRQKYIKNDGHCGAGINYGFPLAACKEVVDIASSNLTVQSLKKDTSLFNKESYADVLKVVGEFFNDSFQEDIDDESFQDADICDDEFSDTSYSDSESESDIDELKNYHVNLPDLAEDEDDY